MAIIRHQFEEYIIEVSDLPDYSPLSADNIPPIFHKGHHEDYRPTSTYLVKVSKDKEEVNQCILSGCGGRTTPHETSSILDNSHLILCCCDSVYCLNVPELGLIWRTKADMSTCFQIFKFEDGYIIHGELEISRIDKDGNVIWQFSGVDIFVSMDGRNEFRINADNIALTDFKGRTYTLGFNGQEIC
jgi:hypothetical protein